MTSTLTLSILTRRLPLQFFQLASILAIWDCAWDCTTGLFFGTLKVPLSANTEPRLSQNVVFFRLSGQQIPWGRDWHHNFLNSWGYNFVSFKGMQLKLIQAKYLISGIFWISFLGLPVTRLSSGQLKNQNSQRFLLRRYVTWNCDTLQKYSAHKIEGLVRFEFSNFIFVTSHLMTSQNELFGHAQYSSKNEEFQTITSEKYNSESLNSLSSIL